MSILLSITFMFLNSGNIHAQKTSNFINPRFEIDSTRTLESLNDSFFLALLSNEYKSIQNLGPSYGLMDSFLRKTNPELNFTTRKIRHAQIIGKFKNEYKRFRKKIKKSDFVLRYSILDSSRFGDYNLQDSIPFCEVTMHCSRKASLYEIDYQAIYIMGQWCLINKLYFHNLRKPKPKTKEKK
jgi:hypothetical protein